MLTFFTLVIMGVVAVAFWREGLLHAVATCVNVLLAGLVAFNFWEPLAGLLEPLLHGYEDAVCLVALFGVTLGTLRIVANMLVKGHVRYHPLLRRGGCVCCGLLTGYLVAGFLVCVLQTLPWHRNFMGFNPDADAQNARTFRQLLPPDRVWLALLHRAGAYPFATGQGTFDRNGTFELRYARYRRYDDQGKTQPYQGEVEP